MGLSVGELLGGAVGVEVGPVGLSVGKLLGRGVGVEVGSAVGVEVVKIDEELVLIVTISPSEGLTVGVFDGVGAKVGSAVGVKVGKNDKAVGGLELVVTVGPPEGLPVGVFVDGTELGTSLATSVG